MFCKKCGGKVGDKDFFCGGCGNQLSSKSEIQKVKEIPEGICAECNENLINLYVGTPMKDLYTGDTKICVKCEVNNYCPVCSGKLKSEQSLSCKHCLSSWRTGQSESRPIKFIKKSNVIKCPKCKSNQITANKKGFSLGKAVIGGVLTGGVGLLGGFIGSSKVQVTCLNCGNNWVPKK
ncbi:MAG TPA: hypothetical protein EYQ06_06190 [Flavobacteriales bacterium]|nr:hypothetical protein [Flavobacteriales bacterium]